MEIESCIMKFNSGATIINLNIKMFPYFSIKLQLCFDVLLITILHTSHYNKII